MDFDFDKYARRMHNVIVLYHTGQAHDCAAATAALLNDRALPRLCRIKVLVVHARVMGDWSVASTWYRANVRPLPSRPDPAPPPSLPL